MNTLSIDTRQAGTPLHPHWRQCVGAGRAREGLDAGWLEQLREAVADGGFRHLRCHGIFHDDMFVYREEGGQPQYNWQYVDAFYDRLLAAGVRPFVELGFSPKALASDPAAGIFWWRGNPSPPRDLGRWGELVTAFARHCLDREHGWAWPAWQALGAPEPPDREQTTWLRTVARATGRRAGRADADGVIDLHLTLRPWEVVCLTTDAVPRQDAHPESAWADGGGADKPVKGHRP